MGFITGDKIESWALSQVKVSVTTVISVDHDIRCKVMKKISIGIDFSKQTFDATVIRVEEYTCTVLAYAKFDNNLRGFKVFEKWVRTSVKGTPEVKDKSRWIFCGEHTGTCSFGLCDFLAKKKYFMWLESPLVIHRMCGIIREKNDKVDSKRIAEYALRNFSDKVRPYQVDSRNLSKLKALHTAHTMLTKDKVAKINQLKSGTLDASPSARRIVESQLRGIEGDLKRIDKEISELVSGCEEFAENFRILNSFKGVGVMTIAYLIIKTRNFEDLRDPGELGCYVGVVPHRCQSGTSVDKAPRTSRYRDRQGNAILSTCVQIALRFNNPIIRPYFDRLVARGVHPNKARNNCKFKIINVLLAMIRNRTMFSMDIHGKSTAQYKTTA